MRLGNGLILLVLLGGVGAIWCLFKLFDLLEIEGPLPEIDYLGLNLFLTLLLITTSWVYVSNKWQKWAIQNVKTDDKKRLLTKLLDSKESMVLKKWSDLDGLDKLFRGGILVVVFCLCFYLDYARGKTQRLFADQGIYTMGVITEVKKNYHDKNNYIYVTYQFQTDNDMITRTESVASGLTVKVEEVNGFDIFSGQEFEVTYVQQDSVRSKINMHKPNATTLEEFKKLTYQSLLNENKDSAYCNCLIHGTEETFGFKGLGKLFHRNTSYWENENYNVIKYDLLVRKDEFVTLKEKCNSKKKP